MSTPSPSVPPPSSGPPGGPPGGSLREFVIGLESERSWRHRGGGEDALKLSALGATIDFERMLREPLKLPLGTLQLGAVEVGEAGDGRFPILRRLGPDRVVPREHGLEGWLWTRSSGSAMTMLGDPDELVPNAALLFTKPLAEELMTACFTQRAMEDLAARSPLGSPAVYGLLFRVKDVLGAERVFRQFGLLKPLTDREVAPTLRRSLPTDRSADPQVRGRDDGRSASSVGPPGMG